LEEIEFGGNNGVAWFKKGLSDICLPLNERKEKKGRESSQHKMGDWGVLKDTRSRALPRSVPER
jgi:hypothetical protein